MKWKFTAFLLAVVLLQVHGKALKKKSFPASPKGKAQHHHHHHKHRDHKKSSVHSSARSHVSDPGLQELINDPQKLDTDEMQQVKMLDFYNSKFMNSELASESQMLINQGIDADSARRIATMDRLPGITGNHHGYENGVSKDTFSSKLGMDIARWPEYHFRDSGSYRIATTTDNKPDPQFISSSITNDDDDDEEENHMGVGGPNSEFPGHHEGSKDFMDNAMMGSEHEHTVMYGHPHSNMFDDAKHGHGPSMDVYDKPIDHAQMSNMFNDVKQFSQGPMHDENHHESLGMGPNQGRVRSKPHRFHK